MTSRITTLFNIRYPVIQGGMIWCSGWKLAAAVSNAGGLGLIGAGSMHPELLQTHIQRCKAATSMPFGVNVPLLYPQTDEVMRIIIAEKVPIVFTSAGSPSKYTSMLKAHGIKVAHVIANTKFARKAAEAGVDAIVAEGFEAGGHNGVEETTTLVLLPLIRQATDLPLIAAGGIASGSQMLAAMALGAEGVQIGSLFAVSSESSAHQAFKQKVMEAREGDTSLMLKKITPVRLLINTFAEQIREAESEGADAETLRALLGKGRAKKGMMEGDLEGGELEIGQASALIQKEETVQEIFVRLLAEFDLAKNQLFSQFNKP